ncbi:hypothetical protein VTI74DRAFT_7717 [Chaetomium olivicolor]
MKSKSALSAGLVAALMFPTSVITGETHCPKRVYGSNRVICRIEVPEHHDHHVVKHEDPDKDHKKGKHHKEEVKNTTVHVYERVNSYTWSFLWNYIATEDCRPVTAQFKSILPILGHDHHSVNCRVQIRWGQDKHHTGNLSWDFVGYNQMDSKSLPATVEWPLPASYGRPDRFIKNREWGVRYEKAHHGDMHYLKIHGDHGNNFDHSWIAQSQSHHGPEGYGKHIDYIVEDHHDKDEHKKKKKKKKNKKKNKNKEHTITVHHHNKDEHHMRTHGHYNTKNLFSCWVFEGIEGISRGVYYDNRHDDGHGHGHDKDKDKGKDAWQTSGFQLSGPHGHHNPALTYTHSDPWFSCTPHVPEPCHHECHGNDCDGDEGCHGGSCDHNDGRRQRDGHRQRKGHGHRNSSYHYSDDCRDGSCKGRLQLSTHHSSSTCQSGVCDGQRGGSRHWDNNDWDDCDDDDCSDDGSNDDCEDDCTEDEGASDSDCGDCGDDDDDHDERHDRHHWGPAKCPDGWC